MVGMSLLLRLLLPVQIPRWYGEVDAKFAFFSRSGGPRPMVTVALVQEGNVFLFCIAMRGGTMQIEQIFLDGKLFLCLSGSQAGKERVQPLLHAPGQGAYDFGEDTGAANVIKLTGNFLIAAAMEAMAEAFTLAEKNGIERTKVIDMLGQTNFACPIYQNYGRIIAEERSTPAAFLLSLGLKDMNLVLRTAESTQMPMPVASRLHDRFIAPVAKGRGDMDWSALALGVSEDAGPGK